jgi:hypothetical protein
MKIDLVYPRLPGSTAGNVEGSSLRAQVAGLEQQLSNDGHDAHLRALPKDAMDGLGQAVGTLDDSWSDDRPDLIHAHLWTSGLAVLAALRDLSVTGSVPVVLTFHAHAMPEEDTADGRLPEWLRLKAAVARGVDRVTATSRRERADLTMLGVRQRDVDVIPPAVDLGLFTPDPTNGDPERTPRVLSAGPMTPASGFETPVRALAHMPDVILVLAGGLSHERDVSLRSGRRVAEALRVSGLDVAERDVDVSVGCAAGRAHRGRLVAGGPDHLGLRLPTGALVLVALDTVRSVRPEPGHRGGAAMGDREPPADRTLAEVLQDLADRDGAAAIALRDVADPLQGTVLGLGEDVMTLRLDTAQRETVLVPLCAIAELLVAP